MRRVPVVGALRGIRDAFASRRSMSSSSRHASNRIGEVDALPAEPPAFEPRKTFSLPATVPSWYAGHMYRAMRSLPSLLAREPPPLIIETRDARLPLSSTNPAFEEMLVQMERNANKERRKEGQGQAKTADMSDLNDIRAWRKRRLIVYNKADLIDARLHKPIVEAFAKHDTTGHADVMFVDSRKDSDVRKVMQWARQRAAMLAEQSGLGSTWDEDQRKAHESAAGASASSLPRSARVQNLSGAFRHTSTPEDGVRLVIVGMPNVGKSSLLNALRRVGTGLGKAASTAPEPGHTRKLTGTVRITKKLPTNDNGAGKGDKAKSGDPAIYVYDTPGVMVPYLGNGLLGAEKGVKLAVASGIKSSLFDAVGLCDYLLFRLNLKWVAQKKIWEEKGDGSDASRTERLPAYLTGLPLALVKDADVVGQQQVGKPTNDIQALLQRLALRAPGTLSKNGERDVDAAAKFMLDRWRVGKLTNHGAYDSGELDTGAFEWSPDRADARWTEEDIGSCVEEAVRRHFLQVERARQQGAATSFRPVKGADRASRRAMERIRWTALREQVDAAERASDDGPSSSSSSLLSKRQERTRKRAVELIIRQNRLRERGVRVEGLSRAKKPSAKKAEGAKGSPAKADETVAKVAPRRDRRSAVRARRILSARAGRKMSGR